MKLRKKKNDYYRTQHYISDLNALQSENERLEENIKMQQDEIIQLRNVVQCKNEYLERIRIQQSDIVQLRSALSLLMEIKKVSPEDMAQLIYHRSIGAI